jgi:hypothetical protein
MNRSFLLSGTLIVLGSLAMAQSKHDPNLRHHASRNDVGTAKTAKIAGVPHRAGSPGTNVAAASKSGAVATQLNQIEHETAKLEGAKPAGKNPSLPATAKIKPVPGSSRNVTMNFQSQPRKGGSRASQAKVSSRKGSGIAGRVSR